MADESLETQALIDAVEFHRTQAAGFKLRAEHAEACLGAFIKGIDHGRRMLVELVRHYRHWNGAALGWVKGEDVAEVQKQLDTVMKLHQDTNEVWWIALNGQNQIIGAYRTKEEAHANSAYVVGVMPDDHDFLYASGSGR